MNFELVQTGYQSNAPFYWNDLQHSLKMETLFSLREFRAPNNSYDSFNKCM